MSAISSPSQSVSAEGGQCLNPATAVEIDASCRVPVLLLVISSLLWLLVSSVFGMIATLKFHSPNLLADCPWFTYGRVHPANLNALIYGFGMQAGLAVALWIIAHHGRVRLACAPLVVFGGILLNLAMTLGTVAILYGESTGYEWLEMPRYASLMFLAGYVLVVLAGLLTLHVRNDRRIDVSQWFILAAFFWFPWIYTTANLLLVQQPVRGALQAGIDFWYINNLKNIWFGFIGLGTIFYFVPKIIQRPLFSHGLAVFAFWTLLLFGSWGGIPAATPLPSWMSALSTAASVILIVPAIAVCLNVRRTICGSQAKLHERTAKFFLFGALSFAIAIISSALTSTIRIGKLTNFTWYVPAQTQWMLYGFFAITMFGAIYYIVPRLVASSFPMPRMVCGQFLLAALGLLLYAVPLMIGGVKEGIAMYYPASDKLFTDIMLSTLAFIRISTTGDFLMALGHLFILLNVFGLLVNVGRQVGMAAWVESTKRVEVVP